MSTWVHSTQIFEVRREMKSIASLHSSRFTIRTEWKRNRKGVERWLLAGDGWRVTHGTPATHGQELSFSEVHWYLFCVTLPKGQTPQASPPNRTRGAVIPWLSRQEKNPTKKSPAAAPRSTATPREEGSDWIFWALNLQKQHYAAVQEARGLVIMMSHS